jgi:hypothetical protein
LKAFKSFLESYSEGKIRELALIEDPRKERAVRRTFWQALESCQGFTPIALLDTDVNIIGSGTNVCAVSKRVPFVCKGICGNAMSARKIDLITAAPATKGRTDWGRRTYRKN